MDNQCWSSEAEKLVVMRMRLASLRPNHLGSVPLGSSHGSRGPEGARLYTVLEAKLSVRKSLPGGAGFEGIKGSWKIIET